MKDALGQRWLIVGIESLGSSKRAEEICKQYLCSSIHTATIVDESSKIKNHTANRAMRAVSFGRMSEYRTIMTGTPIANGPMDMFMQFEFLDPDIIGLGDFYSFRNRYAIMGGYDNKEIIGYRNLDELTEIVAPFVYQVRKKDALDLPPKLYVTREVELTDEQRRLYGTMKRGRIVATGDKSHIVENVLEKMLRLQEIAGGFVSYADAGAAKGKKTKRERIDKVLSKVTELLAIAEEAEGQSVIVWCAFKDEIYACVAALCNVYGRAAVVEIHGDIDEKQRNINKDLFQSGKARFLVGNAATGGLGLDMTAGSIEVYYSNTFNYIDRQQSEDRAHRIGQTKQVTIIDLVARGTVDAVIIEALRQKQNLSEYVRRSIARADTDHLYGETE
jgi:SNF2 family DNA or RNA helicase